MLAENVVPRDAFKGAKGVVFLQAAYAAAGVTAFRGQGFVVAAVNGQWSAPSFLSLSSLGVGLSLGGEATPSPMLQQCIVSFAGACLLRSPPSQQHTNQWAMLLSLQFVLDFCR